MEYTGINQGNVKSNNRSAVLKLLNARGAMSRKDIAAALGLTPATVTLICTELLSAGVLAEQGELAEEKRAGRKKILVGIKYDSRYALCLSLEAEDTCLTICDLHGKPLVTRTLNTDTTADPGDFLQKVADAGKAMLWETGIPHELVLGVGVTVPGLVDRARGISRHAYHLWETPVPVRALLQAQLGYPVVLENNVKAFAEAELIYGSGKQLQNILLIKWGPGVGAAVILQREIYTANNGRSATEIGHMTVQRDGKLCRCGRRGCLETVVSAHAIAAQLRELCNAKSTPQLYDMVEGDTSRITSRSIGKWIRVPDAAVQSTVNADIDQIARMVSNVATFVMPDRVITYGDMFDLPGIRKKFTDCCTHYDPAYNAGYITASRLNERQSYIGSLAVVVREQFFESDSWDAAESKTESHEIFYGTSE